MTAFSAEIVNERPSVLKLSGELTLGTASTLHARIKQLRKDDDLNLLLDLEDLTFCDADGTLALIATCRRVREAGGSASIICPSPTVRMVFQATDVFDFLTQSTSVS
jgi:anti-sigma B factor antagonist